MTQWLFPVVVLIMIFSSLSGDPYILIPFSVQRLNQYFFRAFFPKNSKIIVLSLLSAIIDTGIRKKEAIKRRKIKINFSVHAKLFFSLFCLSL
jgi:hypothetical protein